jgi:hypothetical protein
MSDGTSTADRTRCPPWCTTDHEHAAPGSIREDVHLAAEADVSVRAGLVRACAWWSGSAHTDPHVFVSLPASSGTHGRLSVTPADATGLAELLDLFATATPGQHRKLAAAIRQAAAVLGGDEDPAKTPRTEKHA